jgi:hypothetical protein
MSPRRDTEASGRLGRQLAGGGVRMFFGLD